jgi:hypothetical protein
MLSVVYADCHLCCVTYKPHMVSAIMLSVVMLSVVVPCCGKHFHPTLIFQT